MAEPYPYPYSDDPCWIYFLVDPRDGTIWYVGVTKNPKTRMGVHLHVARRKPAAKRPPVSNWVAMLLSEGVEPVMEVVEETTIALSGWKEINWIRWCRAEGYELHNVHYTLNGTDLSRGGRSLVDQLAHDGPEEWPRKPKEESVASKQVGRPKAGPSNQPSRQR